MKAKMNEKNVLIFPLMKKLEKTKEFEKMSKDDIDSVVVHYMHQLGVHLQNHGIPMNEVFAKDFNLVHESFRAAIFRAAGFYHPIQDIVDTLIVDEDEEIEVQLDLEEGIDEETLE